ncbi:hypothetical protein [Amorphus sp. 3PC139-8]|uniref:hypothetical protein n=1 Tax=Amorphus sp. 3PC139-8 TaxID=2735676 RepID=UPI00345D3805
MTDRRAPKGRLAVAGAIYALSLVAATPAIADDYEVLGRFSGTIGGKQVALWVPYDVANDRSYLVRQVTDTFLNVGIDAVSGEPGVDLERPSVGVSVRGPAGGAEVTRVSVMMPGEDERTWGTGGQHGGTIDRAEVVRDGDRLHVFLRATVRPARLPPPSMAADGDPVVPEPDGKPLVVELEGDVDLREPGK